ncbi:MAG: efflux RND transporter periplasmic adaptor subunit [Brevundimonas sp.]|jgi:Cu(I)/Ag(I) efflux system membrane fusion protein|uniref:efflux RND transporter periplasmic adaptor subunit n=1 Tax=Brevundimonas sp. TaxID=1871086 RepID=UPI000B2716EB|nr:efflux transporter periplasmic adaptor subunit [Brevundimonas sp.]MBU1346139.1 efflux RND transporter periplasmic adaptor subunit [Alphaproteobacteria bacterium]MCA0355485.1 efflux RND transporter periplasmic adaptor subunit [Pseudomonadota bacterium]
MTRLMSPRARLAAAAVLLLAVGLGGGLLAGRWLPAAKAPTAASGDGRAVLYWYDPMVPDQHFDAPGKSPFMDMQLVPRYADEAGAAPGVRIDPSRIQALGVRFATARQGRLADDLTATAVVDFNQRDIAVVQVRAAGFVQRTYNRAPGDIIVAGAPLADLLVPDWGGAQTEYLAVRRSGDDRLIEAARQRLVLLGMPESLITSVERSGRPRTVITVTSPIGGVIRTLGVRSGMSVPAGATLAEINGLSTVWLNAAVPEALAGRLRTGQIVDVTLAAFPGERFTGRLTALLPEVAGESRTVTGRVELANRGGRLRPGMFGQIALGGGGTDALVVPSEAVIRTGTRTLVMLAEPGGRFRPAEVRIGREAAGQSEVLAGLAEGERVVASGQFLIDSEASLSGVEARPIGSPGAATAAAAPTVHQTTGRVEALTPGSITISHPPIASLNWPAMTMAFDLPDAARTRGLAVGDRVRLDFELKAGKATILRLTPVEARP